MAVTLTGEDVTSLSVGSGNPVNFGTLLSGTAAADRISVIALVSRFRNIATAVSYNSISATKVGANYNATTQMSSEVWYCANPSGTNGACTCTTTGTSAGDITASIFRMVGANSTPTDSKSSAGANVDNVTISTLVIPTDGCAVYAMIHGEQTEVTVWTGATAYADRNVVSSRHGSGYVTTGGTPTVTTDEGVVGATNYWSLFGASWGPSGAGPSAFPWTNYYRQYSA